MLRAAWSYGMLHSLSVVLAVLRGMGQGQRHPPIDEDTWEAAECECATWERERGAGA